MKIKKHVERQKETKKKRGKLEKNRGGDRKKYKQEEDLRSNLEGINVDKRTEMEEFKKRAERN